MNATLTPAGHRITVKGLPFLITYDYSTDEGPVWSADGGFHGTGHDIKLIAESIEEQLDSIGAPTTEQPSATFKVKLGKIHEEGTIETFLGDPPFAKEQGICIAVADYSQVFRLTDMEGNPKTTLEILTEVIEDLASCIYDLAVERTKEQIARL